MILTWLCRWLSWLASSCNNDGMIKATLSTGEVRQGPLHPSLTGAQWKARSLDLAKAYKQLAVHPNSRHLAVVGYQKSDNSWKYYASNALPFGASLAFSGCQGRFGTLQLRSCAYPVVVTSMTSPTTRLSPCVIRPSRRMRLC